MLQCCVYPDGVTDTCGFHLYNAHIHEDSIWLWNLLEELLRKITSDKVYSVLLKNTICKNYAKACRSVGMVDEVVSWRILLA